MNKLDEIKTRDEDELARWDGDQAVFDRRWLIEQVERLREATRRYVEWTHGTGYEDDHGTYNEMESALAALEAD